MRVNGSYSYVAILHSFTFLHSLAVTQIVPSIWPVVEWPFKPRSRIRLFRKCDPRGSHSLELENLVPRDHI